MKNDRTIDKTTWNSLVGSVDLRWVVMKEFKSVNKMETDYTNPAWPDPFAIQPRLSFRLDNEKGITFDQESVTASPVLEVKYYINRKKLADFKASYDVLFVLTKGKADDFPANVWQAFLNRTLPLITGPIFRETVQAMAGRMLIPLPPVPLFRA